MSVPFDLTAAVTQMGFVLFLSLPPHSLPSAGFGMAGIWVHGGFGLSFLQDKLLGLQHSLQMNRTNISQTTESSSSAAEIIKTWFDFPSVREIAATFIL